MAFSYGQNSHYLSFTPRSINPSFWLCNRLQRVNLYFNTYPTVGYGFIKPKAYFFSNFWIEVPYFRSDVEDTTYIGNFVIREGFKISLEAGIARRKFVNDIASLHAGIMGRIVLATYDVAYINESSGVEDHIQRYSTLYLGLPFVLGTTVFPFRNKTIGLSMDLLWHVLYRYFYYKVLHIKDCSNILKSYIPEVRFTLLVIFHKTNTVELK